LASFEQRTKETAALPAKERADVGGGVIVVAQFLAWHVPDSFVFALPGFRF